MVVSCATLTVMSTLTLLLKNRQMKPVDLARKLGVNKATVSRWLKNKVPSNRLAEIERETGIAACDIRPDLASVFGKKEPVQ